MRSGDVHGACGGWHSDLSDPRGLHRLDDVLRNGCGSWCGRAASDIFSDSEPNRSAEQCPLCDSHVAPHLFAISSAYNVSAKQHSYSLTNHCSAVLSPLGNSDCQSNNGRWTQYSATHGATHSSHSCAIVSSDNGSNGIVPVRRLSRFKHQHRRDSVCVVRRDGERWADVYGEHV